MAGRRADDGVNLSDNLRANRGAGASAGPTNAGIVELGVFFESVRQVWGGHDLHEKLFV